LTTANFPDSHRTGAVAEIDVERLFISWGWNVGHDRIDAGYDLHVTPDRAIYKGFRFSVQVKGTAQKKRKGVIVAQVSKKRLRQYAEDFLPVFIIRTTPDGSLYWLHAQSWAKENRHKLGKSGSSGVRFEPSQTLAKKENFENYLNSIFQSHQHLSEPHHESILESTFLNSLDTRLGVRLREIDKEKVHEIFAKDESVCAELSFNPHTSPENLKELRDAFEYGLPRSIEVDNLKLTGSPLFDHIANGTMRGSLSISPIYNQAATIHLFPGEKFSVTASELVMSAERFIGQKGIVFTNERNDGDLDISIRFFEEEGSLKAKGNIKLRPSLTNTPIKDHPTLNLLGSWAEQSIRQQTFSIEIVMNGVRLPLPLLQTEDNQTWDFVRLSCVIGRIYLIARAVDSSFTLPVSFSISPEELSEIELAYTLLKGERREIKISTFEFEPTEEININDDHDFAYTTLLKIKILDQLLCEIPVLIELYGYQLKKISGSKNLRMVQSNTETAWISYAENPTRPAEEGWIQKIPSV
jgi:hypothetical protein